MKPTDLNYLKPPKHMFRLPRPSRLEKLLDFTLAVAIALLLLWGTTEWMRGY